MTLAFTYQPERLAATGRLLLTAAMLPGFAFDSEYQGNPWRSLVLAALVGYALYAVLAAAVAWYRPEQSLAAKIPSQALDLLVAAFLSAIVQGAASPFFSLFIFTLFSASLRFGARGVLTTGGLILAFYLSLGIVAWSVPEIDLARFAVRSGYLVVVVILLTYLTTYQQRLRDQISQLALWPREWRPEFGTFVEDLLRRGTALLRANTAVLVWEDGDEPWLFVASIRDGRFSVSTEPPDRFSQIVTSEYEGRSFLMPQRGASGATVPHGEADDVLHSEATPVDALFLQAFGLENVVSAPFTGQTLRGRTFWSRTSEMVPDDIALAEVVTRLIGLSLEQHLMVEQLKRRAVTDERIRLARDLHDGIVQSLAGINLHLHVLDRLIQDSPEQARRTLAEIQDALASDQRELRAYIAQLRPAEEYERESSLAAMIQALARRTEREWGLKVSVHVDPPVDLASAGMREEVYRILREAISNAAKHATASTITGDLRLRGDRVVISVRDDGRGLPFHGRFTLAELQKANRGPITLKERVASVGGEMILDSTPAGTSLDISVPLSLLEVPNAHARAIG